MKNYNVSSNMVICLVPCEIVPDCTSPYQLGTCYGFQCLETAQYIQYTSYMYGASLASSRLLLSCVATVTCFSYPHITQLCINLSLRLHTILILLQHQAGVINRESPVSRGETGCHC